MDKKRCQQIVYPNEQWGSFHGHQCHRKIWKDGFCRQHHPDTVKEKDKYKHEKWDAEDKRNKEIWERAQAEKLACEGVPTEILKKIKVKDLLDKLGLN